MPDDIMDRANTFEQLLIEEERYLTETGPLAVPDSAAGPPKGTTDDPPAREGEAREAREALEAARRAFRRRNRVRGGQPTHAESAGAGDRVPGNRGERNAVPSGQQTHEPWRFFTSEERFGFALSGGGLRSATFNLGLLQGLDSQDLLQHADYVSTVSGGGYAGGFWSAWRHWKRRSLLFAVEDLVDFPALAGHLKGGRTG